MDVLTDSIIIIILHIYVYQTIMFIPYIYSVTYQLYLNEAVGKIGTV